MSLSSDPHKSACRSRRSSSSQPDLAAHDTEDEAILGGPGVPGQFDAWSQSSLLELSQSQEP